MSVSVVFGAQDLRAQKASAQAQARELVALSKKQLEASPPSPQGPPTSESPLKAPLAAAGAEKAASAQSVLEAAQKPDKTAAATFMDQVTPSRCQGAALPSLVEESGLEDSGAFGRPRDHPPLLVFVTLSMRDATLKALYRDVSRVGGRLVIRGLIENRFAPTRARLLDLKMEADIDPPAFEAFGIQRVPTFVYVGAGDATARVPPHDRLQGNVSVAYALETFAHNGTLAGAEGLLARLETGP